MSERNDGGPAFPTSTPGRHGTRVLHHGMSMRDWFAGQALAGMNASPELMQAVTAADVLGETAFERMSTAAYRQADAMLAASTPQASPASEWPAMPDRLPPLPEGYVYVGRGAKATGARYVLLGDADKCWMNPISPFGCIAGCPDLHYAVHASDLAKVRRAQ